MSLFRIFCLILISLKILGCGGDTTPLGSSQLPLDFDSKIFWGSCDHTGHKTTTLRQCREWHGDFFSSINVEFLCSKINSGVFALDYCSGVGLVGICTVPENQESDTRYYYYDVDWTASDAAKHCITLGLEAAWTEAT